MSGLRLRHLVDIGPRPSKRLAPFDEVSFAPMEAIKDGIGGLRETSSRPYAELASGSYNYFEDGDILVAKVTPCFENGKKALAFGLTNGVGFATSEVHVLRPKQGRIDPRFLLYLASSANFVAEGAASMTGAGGLRRVAEAAILNHRPKVTDLQAQREIVDFLDDGISRIDDLIQRKSAFVALSNRQWSAFLDSKILGGAETVKAAPPGWRATRLKYLTNPMRPIMYGIVLPGPNQPDGPMIVKGGDVKPDRLHPDTLCRTTTEIEAGYKRSRLKADDLVISIRGGIGDVEIVPKEIEGANLTQDAARIAPGRDVHGPWLRYALLAPTVFYPLEAKSMGAAVRGINIFDLKRVVVPTPPRNTQEAISADLQKQEHLLDTLKVKVRNHASRLRDYRIALITAAVTGQIDVATYSKRGTTDRVLDRIEAEMEG